MTAARTAGRAPAVRATRALGAALASGVLSLTVTGREQVPTTGPILLAGNHSGLLDGPLVYLLSPRPVAMLAKSELYVGRWPPVLDALGLIPVHRGTADRAALQRGLAHLAAAGALCVFPEGTRGSGDLARIADGLAYLALRSGAAVVPVAVSGTALALPRGARLPRLRAPVRIAFGAPVTLTVEGDPRARRTLSTAAEQLRLALLDHLQASTGALT